MTAIRPRKIIDNGIPYYLVRIRRAQSGIDVQKRFHTRREANAYALDLESRLTTENGVVEHASAITFGELVQWAEANRSLLKNGLGRPFPDGGFINFRDANRFLAQHGLERVPMAKLTWELIERLLDDLGQQRSWAAKTRYNKESQLSVLLENARRHKKIKRNVVKMDALDRDNHSESRERLMERWELDQLLDACDTCSDSAGMRMLQMFLRLTWQIGNRKSELLKLTWNRVTWIDDHKVVGAKIDFTPRTTKTSTQRASFIDKQPALVHRAHEPEIRRTDSRRVFPARKGKAPDGTWSVDKPFAVARKAAGLDGIDEEYGERLSLHHFRHSYATRLADAGASLVQIMAGGGWKTFAMAQRYVKVQEKHAMEAAMHLLG